MNAASEPLVYLVAVDGGPSSPELVRAGARLAQAGGAAELHLVHVIVLDVATAVMPPAVPAMTDALEEGRKLLEQLAAEVEAPGFKIVGHLAFGEPWREIVEMAARIDAELVVVGTAARKGLQRLALGSVAERVAREARCAVFVARRKDHHGGAVPAIDPPCAACAEIARTTNREKLWCPRHAEHHVHGHTHYAAPEAFGVGSMLLRP